MKILTVVLAVAVLGGCKEKQGEDMMPAPGSSGAMGPGGAMGSSMMSGKPNPSATAPEWDAAPGAGSSVAPKTGDELAKRYEECWSYLNDQKWDLFAACYKPDAVFADPGAGVPDRTGVAAQIEQTKQSRAVFPDEHADLQFLMISDQDAIGILLVRATQASTKKQVGLFMGHVATFDSGGRLTYDASYYDNVATVPSQLGLSPLPARPVPAKGWPTKVTLISKHDATETANLATFDELLGAINKHDAKAVGALLADDVVWSEQALDKDLDKKAVLASMPALWKGFSDLKFTPIKKWAAGDYVAAVETFEGTNDGDLASLRIKKTGKQVSLPMLAVYRIEGGKVKASWLFWQKAGLAMQLGAGAKPPTK
ncbi:MAG TPA: ester cyclase [Kofleriaceae bacterium]|nr:ester cyclase [Kofleriaceae bacterium]